LNENILRGRIYRRDKQIEKLEIENKTLREIVYLQQVRLDKLKDLFLRYYRYHK